MAVLLLLVVPLELVEDFGPGSVERNRP